MSSEVLIKIAQAWLDLGGSLPLTLSNKAALIKQTKTAIEMFTSSNTIPKGNCIHVTCVEGIWEVRVNGITITQAESAEHVKVIESNLKLALL
jgi:hypothetical protein